MRSFKKTLAKLLAFIACVLLITEQLRPGQLLDLVAQCVRQAELLALVHLQMRHLLPDGKVGVIFFPVRRKVATLVEVGLGYIKLGQSSTTLSGGEAQRVKLATELSRCATGSTIYILDEPTTGLHTYDVHKLTEVLQRLVELGNTVLVIEHNLDVIKTADYIIDLGPEGGTGGGTIVATGTPEEIAQHPASYTGKYLRGVL